MQETIPLQDATAKPGAPSAGGRAASRILYGVAIAGAVAVLALRLWAVQGLPLWLDETWTAVIAGQSGAAGFWRFVWLDNNGPLYYIVMAAWPTGGDFALRLPSLLFMCATPVLVLAWKTPVLSREARLAWAALLFFWAPGLLLSADARCYAMLLLLSAAQAIAFARLIEAPDVKRAAAWCGLAGLAVATHYFAALPAIVQGVFYLALHRGRAVRTFPALLVLAPLAAWGIYHLPRLLILARPGTAWYDRLSLKGALDVAAFTVGAGLMFVLALGVVLVLCRRLTPEAGGNGARWTAISGVTALILLVAFGMKQPFLVERYLTPVVPSMLLGVVLLARAPAGYAAVAALYLLFINPIDTRAALRARAAFGLDVPVRFLLEARPDTLTYSLGYAGAAALDEQMTSEFGRYFFARAGQRVEARMIVSGNDPLRELAAAARGERPSLILLYELPQRPDPAVLGPQWHCRDFRNAGGGSLACATVRRVGMTEQGAGRLLRRSDASAFAAACEAAYRMGEPTRRAETASRRDCARASRARKVFQLQGRRNFRNL